MTSKKKIDLPQNQSTSFVSLEKEVSSLKLKDKKNEASIKQFKTILAIFEEFSGLKINTLENNSYECELKNSNNKDKIPIRFTITINENEVEYIPLKHDPQIEKQHSYLTQPICFERNQFPVFLHNLLSYVYQKSE